MTELADAIQAVRELSKALCRLRDLRVIRSRRFTGDLGEWYVATLYEGQQAISQTQKGWDVFTVTPSHRLQVKAQTFDRQNQWNYLETDSTPFDRLVVVILTDCLTIKTLYDVPSADLVRVLRTGKEDKPIYHFSDLEPWRTDVSTLPGYLLIPELVEDEARQGS
jgi:hypothetical protein